MKFKEECGVFGGILFEGNIAPTVRDGLFMLQHRGQENAGLCCGNEQFTTHKGKGLVHEVLPDFVIKNIKGSTGIGHVRYSTQGSSDELHAQPYKVRYFDEDVAIAHNGNVSATIQMRKDLEAQGETFLTSSDTEMLLKKVIKESRKPPSQWKLEDIGKILVDNFTGGAWSLLFGFPGRLMGFRDPFGYRPLMFCEAEEGYFIASEDCAFQHLNPKKVIEIQPGEAIEITINGYKIIKISDNTNSKKCVFEHIYFAKPYSNIFGRNVYNTRVELGRRCAVENPVEADVVVPIMDSGFAAAIGYSELSKIPIHMGLMRNHWEGRSFIQPDQQSRQKKVIRKLTPMSSVIKDKRIILVDDSIVRGTTSREIVRMMKKAGAKEVHFRISAPRLVNTCEWGVDIPTQKELIANKFEKIVDINNFIESDSLGYLSFKTLKEIFEDTGWCYHCFTK
jgi:amidophosphoribosyltransferase